MVPFRHPFFGLFILAPDHKTATGDLFWQSVESSLPSQKNINKFKFKIESVSEGFPTYSLRCDRTVSVVESSLLSLEKIEVWHNTSFPFLGQDKESITFSSSYMDLSANILMVKWSLKEIGNLR